MDFQTELDTLKREIEERLTEFIKGEKENAILGDFYQDIKAHVLAGGKRLRPIAMIPSR